MKSVLVVSVHPDDETLGVGGTLLKHKANGDSVTWLIITAAFERQGFSHERIESRKLEIEKVEQEFEFNNVFKLDFPTGEIDSSSVLKMIPQISQIFNLIKPEIIYSINRSDAHSDHRFVFDAVMSCCKSFRYPFIKKVLLYECISETEFAPALHEKVFIPNYFVDISDFLDKKLQIMSLFESEIAPHPFPRSLRNIEALATYRGAIAGVEYAEAFQLILCIDKN